jgi:hypothetical protein
MPIKKNEGWIVSDKDARARIKTISSQLGMTMKEFLRRVSALSLSEISVLLKDKSST